MKSAMSNTVACVLDILAIAIVSLDPQTFSAILERCFPKNKGSLADIELATEVGQATCGTEQCDKNEEGIYYGLDNFGLAPSPPCLSLTSIFHRELRILEARLKIGVNLTNLQNMKEHVNYFKGRVASTSRW